MMLIYIFKKRWYLYILIYECTGEVSLLLSLLFFGAWIELVDINLTKLFMLLTIIHVMLKQLGLSFFMLFLVSLLCCALSTT